MPQSPSRVRFIGSRELHRDLPKVLDSLENTDARFVLTIHSKPKAVLIGAEDFLEILRMARAEDRLLALQLGALVQGPRIARQHGRGRHEREWSLIVAVTTVRLSHFRLAARS